MKFYIFYMNDISSLLFYYMIPYVSYAICAMYMHSIYNKIKISLLRDIPLSHFFYILG
jgi:hypothetical protein